MDNNEFEVFAPWRIVATFSDGSRLTFDGITEEQARAAAEKAMDEHGDISWWNRVTDKHYEDGRYYKTVPEPPFLGNVHLVDTSGYNGPLDSKGFPVGLLDEIARSSSSPDDPQIIIKQNETE